LRSLTYVFAAATDLVELLGGDPPELSPSRTGLHRTDNREAVDLLRTQFTLRLHRLSSSSKKGF
jgi:hypothetical protein